MAQAASRRPLTVEAQVHSQTIPREFLVDATSPTLIRFSHNSYFLFSAVPYQVIHPACQTDSSPIVPLFAALLICVDRDFAVIL
jgi:hypothetical protein